MLLPIGQGRYVVATAVTDGLPENERYVKERRTQVAPAADVSVGFGISQSSCSAVVKTRDLNVFLTEVDEHVLAMLCVQWCASSCHDRQ